MTLKQSRCLTFIREYIMEHGVAPSYPEIAEALGLWSRSNAHALVCALVNQGELIRTASRARNLRLPGVDLSRVPTDDLRAEIEKRGAVEEYVTVTLSKDGTVTTSNAFDADFDEMVRATERIIKALTERLSNRKFCPYSHGAALKHALDAPTPKGEQHG